jgi:nitrate/nitrite transporter NarK
MPSHRPPWLAQAGCGRETNYSIGNLGGFVGPYAVGWIKDATGETTLGLVVLAAGPIMAGVATFLMGHDSKIEMAGSSMMVE